MTTKILTDDIGNKFEYDEETHRAERVYEFKGVRANPYFDVRAGQLTNAFRDTVNAVYRDKLVLDKPKPGEIVIVGTAVDSVFDRDSAVDWVDDDRSHFMSPVAKNTRTRVTLTGEYKIYMNTEDLSSDDD